ncbi:MAG: class I SAM-dependent methyltransferase, partial [Planctomycetes bacterium]|nr:class I SAM-dependent methyltransferase [Planctomycetota bacterium]
MSENDRRRWDAKYADCEPADSLQPDEWLVQHISACKPGRALDLACGLGHNAVWLVEHGWQVDAVDISPKLVEHMRNRAKEEGLENVEVVLSKENSIELPAASVDFVFVCDTYHHFEFYTEMLLSIRDALRPGGQLIIIEFERIPGTSREWVLGHVRAGKERFKSEIQQSGFRFIEEVKIAGFRENYFL